MRLRHAIAAVTVLIGTATGCEDDAPPVPAARPILSTNDIGNGYVLGYTEGFRWDMLLASIPGQGRFHIRTVEDAEYVCTSQLAGTFEIRPSSYEPFEEWWCNDIRYIGSVGPVDHNPATTDPEQPVMPTVPPTIGEVP